MMLDRDRLNFWVRFVAIFLAAIFLVSSVLIGFSATGSYNLLEVFGNDEGQQQAGQTTDLSESISDAEQNLADNPEDPEAYQQLGALYFQDNQLDKAVEILERGREVAPDNAELPAILGQVYLQQAQAAPDGERQKIYAKAGDALATATERNPEEADLFLAAGAAYDEAGQPGEAIQYWNGYLDLEPDGETADQVRERISALLEGEDTTGDGAATQPQE